MRLKLPYGLAIAVRVLISVSTRTFFQPDEYFQCLEPAHHIAFGYGHLTWEWVSSKPIRSVAYPAIWAWLFKLLAWAGFDSDEVIVSRLTS
jgi:phosphatidylinositol glycan class B